ncbi:hypothetical protein [Streptomyces sp. CFMR 7]|uniref:hypothetical protein n=1 Tax=Streptomyces sp. CFMR 7 TaxID=1649184 RepID=UPI000AD24744|nr:hypothetical protein [Streptomyces sp. CFMR 7]
MQQNGASSGADSGTPGSGVPTPVQRNTAFHGGVVNAVQCGSQTVENHFYPEPLAPDPWLTPEQAFDDPRAAAYYSHHWGLVGRSELLEQMISFLTEGSAAEGKIGVLLGVAGGGKSRMLRALAAEFARRTEGAVRVLPASAAVDHRLAERLPTGTGLLVMIEDVHQRPDGLTGVLGEIRRERPNAAILLSTRPSGTAALRTTLRQLRIDDAQVPSWEVGELSTRDAAALAGEALGEEKRHLARRLAAAVGDSPFLLVFSAVEIARGRLDPRWLESDAGLHRQVAEAFIATALTDPVTRDDDRALLYAVAAMQPVRTDVPHFFKAMEALLGTTDTVLRAQLVRLVNSGVLTRRGSSHRILPDLLGDVLLAEAAIDPGSGSPTTFLERVLAHADGGALTHLLVNTGRVDWQWSRLRPMGRSPVEPLWRRLESAYGDGDPDTRSSLLKIVRRVAPFQPRRALDLVRPVVDAGSADARHLLDDIPPVIAAAAQDPDHLGEALDLLWRLGQCDPRPLHSTPASALRLLHDLASYSRDKPLLYQEAVIDAVARWTRQGAVYPDGRMPFALLDRIFETVAEHHERDGWTLTISRLPLSADRVTTVRARAYQVLLEAYGSPDPAQACAAARSFAEAFRDQRGPFEGSLVPALQALAARTREVRPGPLVALAVRRSVYWQVNYGHGQAAEMARAVLDPLPDSLPHRLAVLMYSDAHEWAVVDDEYDFAAAERDWEHRLDEAAEEASTWSDGVVWEILCDLLETGRHALAETPAGCSQLVARMVSGRPTRALAVVRGAMERDDNTVDLVLAPALGALWASDPRSAEGVVTDLPLMDRVASLRSAVRASEWRIATGEALHPQEFAMAGRLSSHPDTTVRTAVLRLAATMIHRSEARTEAVALLCSVPFSDLGRGAADFCWAFVGPNALTWTELTSTQRASCVAELEKVPTLEDHRVQKTVTALSEAYEDDALHMVLGRLEAWEHDAGPHFVPLPFAWSTGQPFRNSPNRGSLLRRVVQWFGAERENPWRRELYGVDLFTTIAGDAYDSEAREVLLECFRSCDPARMDAVAPLLSGGNGQLLWEETGFVAEVLRSAAEQSEELYRKVGGHLMSSVTCGSKSTVPGQPFPKDIEIQERAAQARVALPAGSPEDRLYAALQDHASAEISRALGEDLDVDARRNW